MEVFKGTIAGVASALIFSGIQQFFRGQINYWWVAGGFLGAFFVYLTFKGYENRFPYKKWRVTNDIREGKGLRSRKEMSESRPVGEEAWQFRASVSNWAIYGPYLTKPLPKGRYKAIFKLKVDDLGGENRTIIDIDVASNCRFRGEKRLALRSLTPHDFKRADQYCFFSLFFDVLADEGERDLELRIYSYDGGQMVTLDYIQLSRRLF